MVDTHTHLNLPPLSDDQETYLANALQVGVNRMMIVGVNCETSKKAVALAKQNPQLWAAVGIHPDEADTENEKVSLLEEMVTQGNVSAIGECGLDYTGTVDHEVQKRVFKEQATLAISSDLPLLIHCRNTRRSDEVVSYDAYADLLVALDEVRSEQGKYPRFILHCASGSVEYVQKALQMGAYISFAGNVTYPNAGAIRDLLTVTPLDRLLVETDAPFLSPQSRRGTQNEPANVVETAKFVAQFLNKSFEEIDECTTANALRIFQKAK